MNGDAQTRKGMNVRLLTQAKGILKQTFKIELAASSYFHGISTALAMVLPLALGIAFHHPSDGSMASVSALLSGMITFQGAYRSRLIAVLVCGITMVGFGYLGSISGSNTALFALAISLTAGASALSSSLGPLVGITMQQTLLLMAVASALPTDAKQAAVRSAYILAGVLAQGAVVVLSWLRKPGQAELDKAGSLFLILARYCRTVAKSNDVSPPLFPDYHSVLDDPNPFASTKISQQIRSYFDSAEHIRVQLVGLAQLFAHINSEELQRPNVEMIFSRLAELLEHSAESIRWSGSNRSVRINVQLGLDAYQAYETLLAAMDPAARTVLPDLLSDLEFLGKEHPSSVTLEGTSGIDGGHGSIWRRAYVQIAAAFNVLIANLNLRSDYGRHALRTAATVAFAVALARMTGLSRGYWVVITVSVVLKPDYTTTFRRTFERLTGTILGVGIALLLLVELQMSQTSLVIVLLFLGSAAYSLFPANYTIFVSLLSALVVVLLDIAGISAHATAITRLIDTGIGGAIAIAAYRIWPTWGENEVFGRISALLLAQRAYVSSLLNAVTDPAEADKSELSQLLIDARAARIAAEASLDRIANEPKRPAIPLRQRDQILRSTRAVAGSCLEIHSILNSIHSEKGQQIDRRYGTDAYTATREWISGELWSLAQSFAEGGLDWEISTLGQTERPTSDRSQAPKSLGVGPEATATDSVPISNDDRRKALRSGLDLAVSTITSCILTLDSVVEDGS